jgi:crotonobetainyl-CoA:carnitine CoA-transferase CaiB-like acyl-CoA transferase
MVVGRAAPCLGADTRAVLQEWLGLPEDEIERLAQAGVIPAGDEPEPAG